MLSDHSGVACRFITAGAGTEGAGSLAIASQPQVDSRLISEGSTPGDCPHGVKSLSGPASLRSSSRMATAAPSLAPEAARQPSQLLCSLADLEATHPAAAAPAAASDPCLRTLQIGASPASMSAVSQAAAAALIRRASGPITGGPAMVPVADLPSRSGGSAAAAAPRKGGAADGTVAEAEPDDGMTEEWFASVAETPSPYSLNLRQHRKVHGYFVEHVARMVFKHR